MMSMQRRRVCIVGAGGAGLVALRHVKETQGLEGVVLERRGQLGGIWNYEGGTHNPMYKGLRTNLPKQVMGYPDYHFVTEEDQHSFVSHETVLQFLCSYAKEFGLWQHIKFQCTVVNMEPLEEEEEEAKWRVAYEKTTSAGTVELYVETFAAVMICNGHFAVPHIPQVPGLSTYEGILIHSKDYNCPKLFEGMRVVGIGGGHSGIDIMLDILPHASHVTLSMKNPPYPGTLPLKVQQKPPPKRIQGRRVFFEDESSEECDAIVLCTGYDYSFPFLDPKCKIEVREEGKVVGPLYKQLININHPTMAFIGLPFRVIPFILFDVQARYFVRSLEGHFPLPTKQEMMEDLRKETDGLTSTGIPLTYFHKLSSRQWEYMAMLAKDGDLPPKIFRNFGIMHDISDKVRVRRELLPAMYKKDKISLSIQSDGSFGTWTMGEECDHLNAD